MAQHDLPTIDQLENTAQTDITHALRDAYRNARHAPRTPREATRTAELIAQSLRQATAPTTDTLTTHTRTAATNGAHTGRTEAPPPDGNQQPTLPDDTQTDQLTADIPIRDTTRRTLRDTALALETRPQQLLTTPPDQPIRHTENTLRGHALTFIHRARNRGRTWYAALFNYDLQWVTEEDDRVCPICTPLHLSVIASRRRFEAEPDWEHYDGQPPAHPMCRCEAQVVRRAVHR